MQIKIPTFKEIKEARDKASMTQIEVASEVGVSVAAYRIWEKGGGRPTPENAQKLKEVLNMVEVADNDDTATAAAI